jgi:hypothetical protein
VDGVTLRRYADVCRALVREGGDTSRRVDAVLAAHGLSPATWSPVHEAWTKRIREEQAVRSAFQRFYAGPPPTDVTGNE